MRIFVDIGHPAHVHYFRNFIKIMTNEGHIFFVSARNKEISHILLEKYGISFFNRGKGSKGILGKVFYTPLADFRLLLKALSFKPDVFLSFGSPYAAHVAWALKKPHVALTDTEHARLGIWSFQPFSKYIITSHVFKKDFGAKHYRFRGLIEWAYLNPKYFKADKEVLATLGLRVNEKFVIVRFVDWNATHDIGHNGIKNGFKEEFVTEISKYAKVYISSEAQLPERLQPFKLSIPVEKMHDVLKYASLYIGESGTMSTEAALLGIPAINISTSAVGLGSFEELENRGIMFVIPDNNAALAKAVDLLIKEDISETFSMAYNEIKTDYDDISEYLVNFFKKTFGNE
jgi:uncharacterized protein